jgi:enamine deaminase RidA (YjgF/YER057c/UK114 family)
VTPMSIHPGPQSDPPRTSRGEGVKLALASGALLLTVMLIVLFVLAEAANAQTRTNASVLMSENPGARKIQDEWGFSDAVIVGNTIYLSGIVAGLRQGDSDVAGAYDRVYRQIGNILKRAGASWDDVVDMTSFHTDVEGQIETLAGVHKRYVKAPYPAWTAIGVAKVLGGGITEIKVTARRPAGAPASR